MAKKKVMILSVSAGSGHLRAAEALEEACRKDDRVEEVRHIDALAFTNKVFQEIYSKGYIEAVKKAPELWAIAFDETDVPWHRTKALSVMQRLNAQPLVNELKRFEPDICLCTHFMPADIISRLIQADKLHTNVGVVVTDYYVHATWLCDIFTRYFVGKQESKVFLEAIGLPTDRIEVSGIPISQDFSQVMDRGGLLKKHGLLPDRPVVLLSAGTFGVMPAKDIFRILERIKTPAQLVVVCGHNDKLKEALNDYADTALADSNKRYVILGYTDVMHELLAVADLFIGKPGGLTTSECMAAGVPMIVWDPIPGQEWFNACYLLESGAGIIPDNAVTIGYKVDSILGDAEKLKKMSNAARAIAKPDAASHIVDAMLKNENETPVKAFKKKM